MSVILAIDPGSEQSAWLILHGAEVRNFDLAPNALVLAGLRGRFLAGADVVVIEQIESYGMPVGREVFETVRWAGRFEEAAAPRRVVYLPRRAVKLHLCNSPRATDASLRAALIDRFGGVGGKRAAVGVKAAPGPLYGVHADVRQALAVAVTWQDQEAVRQETLEQLDALGIGFGR
jgi:hypothetical protein